MHTVLNLKDLILGQSINVDLLKRFINEQSFQRHGNQLIGEVAIWAKAGVVVEDSNHIDYAPAGTLIELREHYVGSALLCLHDGKWMVTSIRYR